MGVPGQFVAEQIIEIGVQSACCHHTTILTFEGAARGIARIGEERFFARFAFGVEAVERVPWHQHLPANFEVTGPVSPRGELQRDGTNGAHVGRHVVAAHPVTTCQGTHQRTVLIVQRNAQTVELQFTADRERFAVQTRLHAFIKFAHVVAVVRVAEREHRSLVFHLFERLVQVAAHALSGTVGVVAFRVCSFERLEFVHEFVELPVGDFRSVLYVIQVVMVVQGCPELVYAVWHDAVWLSAEFEFTGKNNRVARNEQVSHADFFFPL